MEKSKHLSIFVFTMLVLALSFGVMTQTAQNKKPAARVQKVSPPNNQSAIVAARKRLIQQILGAPTNERPMTQSEAYWSIPMLQAAVKNKYPFITEPKWQSLINKMMARERQYEATHYVFYHGFTKSWLVPGDFYLALYKRLRPLNKNITDFRFLRFEPSATQDINTFIINEMNAEGLVQDHSTNARASIISVNLALFGNTNNDGESTFHYFLKPTSHVKVGDWAWEMILNQFHAPIDPKIIKQLNALDETYLSQEIKSDGTPKSQAILQIFVPKNIVDKVAYFSYIEGIPRHEPLIAWIENIAKDSPLKSLRYSVTKEVIDAIRQLFKEQPNHPMKQKILAEIRGNKFRISSLLEEYKKNPQFIPNLNDLQARLFFTNDVLLHPTSNVLFFEYDLIPAEQKAAYHKALNRIADEVMRQVLQRAKQSIPQATPTPQRPAPQVQKPAPATPQGASAASPSRIAELQAQAKKIFSPDLAVQQQAIKAREELMRIQGRVW